MTVTTTISKTHTLSTADLPFDADLDYEPDPYIDPVVTMGENGVFTVAYAVRDEYCHEYDWQEGVAFFNADRNYISPATQDEAESADHTFLVERYEHGMVRYALTGESSAVDRQWDVSGAVGLLGIPDDFTDPEAAARSILDEYTNWCNGEVYGIVKQTFDYQGNPVGATEDCWGFIGSEYAESVVKDIDSHL